MLAADEVSLRVEGQAVGLAARCLERGHFRSFRQLTPAHGAVGRNIAEEQRTVPPDRAFGEGEAAGDPLDSAVRRHQAMEGRMMHFKWLAHRTTSSLPSVILIPFRAADKRRGVTR